MIEALASWTIGALLGTVLRRATRARRRREGARARQRRAVRALLDELSAFAAGLELDIEHSATIRIANPEAVEVTWREHRDVLAGLPARDVNIIERAVIVSNGNRLELENLPEPIRAAVGARRLQVQPRTLAEVEAEYVAQVLHNCGGNKTEAARILGISRKNLYEKLARTERMKAEG